ncbi:hypothetical protein GGR50DRAFT_643021 [Xylaria sp. CBS 124048]|nr:hypothetical protein GGR50DRAFT_643021 [Xylaria sp. CBS 124048]
MSCADRVRGSACLPAPALPIPSAETRSSIKEKEKEEKKKKNLGVALVAEIAIRPIQRPCWLADAVVQEKIWSMARDPTHARFRHTYLNGRVWFFFRVTDLEVARRPMGVGEGDGEGEMLVEDGDEGGDWIIV